MFVWNYQCQQARTMNAVQEMKLKRYLYGDLFGQPRQKTVAAPKETSANHRYLLSEETFRVTPTPLTASQSECRHLQVSAVMGVAGADAKCHLALWPSESYSVRETKQELFSSLLLSNLQNHSLNQLTRSPRSHPLHLPPTSYTPFKSVNMGFKEGT